MYDPLLVRYLAEELDRAIRGRACAAAPLFSADLSVVLPLEGDRALRLDLHPARGWVRLVGHPGGSAAVDSRCTGVAAPLDERRISIGLAAPERFGGSDRRLVIELHTNQWNALLVAADDDRIISVLRARTAGERELRPGAAYTAPGGEARFGAGAVDAAEARDRWETEIGAAAPAARRGALIRGFAYTGAPNAAPILGPAADGGDPGALRGAFDRWWTLRALPPATPTLLHTAGGASLPYPLPLPGAPGDAIGSLLEGMERVAASGERPPAAAPAQPGEAGLADAVRARADALERRVRRIEEELAAAGDADRLRSWGDLLLARLHEIPRGAERVEMEGWDGETVTIPLDPALSPPENATRLYEEARKRGRAEERLPGLLEEARAEASRWGEAARAAAGGEIPAWAGEALTGGASAGSGGRADAGAEARPYRVFRTSGGLEVRVGRSARANDRLTFGHSSPNDVWLHAQSVPGSHVVLRWSSVDESPPARDLEEAAVLAARYSRARTSALVAVDWTRRKHVRKPRGAPAGSVVLQRAKTLFVEPDPAVEERLRTD